MSGSMCIAGALALGVVLAGCGLRNTPEEASSSASTSATQAPSSENAAPNPTDQQTTPPFYTVADYLRDNGVTQTMVKHGDAGAPTLNLPVPPGWRDLGADAPSDAWGAVVLDSAGTDNPPGIVARLARLDGDVDPAKILELAPNAIRNEPGYDGPPAGQPGKLAGADAVQIAGNVEQDGQQVLLARNVAVLAVDGVTYLLVIDAQGTPDQQEPVMSAMSIIDAQSTVAP
jgi:hypothetical protein